MKPKCPFLRSTLNLPTPPKLIITYQLNLKAYCRQVSFNFSTMNRDTKRRTRFLSVNVEMVSEKRGAVRGNRETASEKHEHRVDIQRKKRKKKREKKEKVDGRLEGGRDDVWVLWKFGFFRNIRVAMVFARMAIVLHGGRFRAQFLASCSKPTRCILSRDNASRTIRARGWDGR